MIYLTTILVPVDFSPASVNAVRYGLAAASQFQARLVLAHIVPTFAGVDYVFPEETFDIEKRAYAEAQRRLPELVPPEYRDQIDFHSVVKTGDVRNELLGIIDEEKANLVVMGTHGHRPVERFFLGSTVDALLRRVPVPLLTVLGGDVEKGSSSSAPAKIRRIVYATDFSEGAKSGLHYAAELSRRFQAGLAVLHVIPRISFSDSVEMQNIAGAITPYDAATKRVQQLADVERRPDLRLETAVIEGTPHDEINNFAESTKADLIVLNVQGKSPLDRALIGSTAEGVIRSARVPVLSIPTSTAERFTGV